MSHFCSYITYSTNEELKYILRIGKVKVKELNKRSHL